MVSGTGPGGEPGSVEAKDLGVRSPLPREILRFAQDEDSVLGAPRVAERARD